MKVRHKWQQEPVDTTSQLERNRFCTPDTQRDTERCKVHAGGELFTWLAVQLDMHVRRSLAR